MAFRLKRSKATDNKPESMRKRRKLNSLFNETDLPLADRAEISISGALTANEKRIEIGKRILSAAQEKIEFEMDDDIYDDPLKKQLISDHLLKQIKVKEGKYFYTFGNKLRSYLDSNPKSIKIASIRGHRLSVTCLALDPLNTAYAITGSKDGSVIKWSLKNNSCSKIRKVWHAWPLNKRFKSIIKHANSKKNNTRIRKKWSGISYKIFKKLRPKAVLAVAISPDGKWLITGGEDSLIRVWNAHTMRYKSTFRGHRSAVTGLSFCTDKNSSTLFTSGRDRQIRIYDMNEMGFAEPLYGHTLGINHIRATSEDRCLTVADDRTVRYWKLRTQSQLIFKNAHDGFIDACALITPGKFVTGSADGSIAFWSVTKKKPLHMELDAHLSANLVGNGRVKHWICSLACRTNCDVFASGSSDGVVRIWCVKQNSFQHIRSVRIPKGGFVNCMEWSEDGSRIICGIGSEHRLGRWDTVKGARNGICIIQLPFGCVEELSKSGKEEEDEESNGISYSDAETWNKWNCREKGERPSIVKGSIVNGVKNAMVDELSSNEKDEWSKFFGVS